MFRKVSGLVLALALVLSSAGVLLGPPALAHAGGQGQERVPSVEWFNPPSMMYGGWDVTTAIYLKNPTGIANLKFSAEVWFNGAVVDPFSVHMRSVSWPNIQIDQVNCDGTGCLGKALGTISSYGRTYVVFGMRTGRSLGANMTVGSVRVTFENYDRPAYAEGRTNLVEGPGFSASIGLDAAFSPSGGYKTLVVEVTDRVLNNFQLLGVGADCANAVMPDDHGYSARYDSTVAKWYVGVYVPDNAGRCMITALIKTRDTVVSATFTINPS